MSDQKFAARLLSNLLPSERMNEFEKTLPRIHFNGKVFVKITRSDMEAIEKAADASTRAGEYQTALDAYSVALRLRSETGFHPLRRAGDEPST